MPSAFSRPPIRCCQARRARDRPRPRAALVARVGQERLVAGSARSRTPGRSPAGRRPTGIRHGSDEEARNVSEQQDHRRAVADRDPHRLERRRRSSRPACSARSPAAATRRGGRTAPSAGPTARSWSASRSTGRRAARRSIDHRQLEHHRQPDRLGLQVHARAARRGDAEPAAERGAQRHPGGGDLVLGLDRAHAELVVARELVQQLGGGRDRIARQQQRQPAADARRRSAPATARWCR